MRRRQLFVATILTAVIVMLDAPIHALTLTTSQCASWLYNMTFTGLEPGWYLPYNLTVPASSIALAIQANVVSNVPVEAAIFTPNGHEIWSTQPSTTLTGTYTVALSGPGTYQIAVYNPSSNTEPANIYGWFNVTMCGPGAAQAWLSQFTRLWTTDVVSNGANLTMAPMGIVAYGVINASGQYYAYTLTTDAVKGVVYIPQSASINDYYPDGTYYGNAFSIQLNAYVAVELANGQTQYYWVQNVVQFMNGALWVSGWIWNETTSFSHLSPSAIRGNGTVWTHSQDNSYSSGMPNPVPFGWVTLEISAGVSGGSVVVRFYADGQNYDTVTITPSAPATSAYIVIAPKGTARGTPLDLELVFAGLGSGEPYAVLQSGTLQLQLYVDVNGAWAPPPSAWTVGYSTYEEAYASVSSNGMGSAAVSPGPPDVEELWGGSVIVSPIGVLVTTGVDLTQYLPQMVNFGNGTRLVLKGVVINGQPAGLNALGSVPLGSLVLATYVKQYLVSIYAPTNTTATWVDAGTAILVDEPGVVNFDNGTRLINPTLNGEPLPATITVNTPLELTVAYTRQYYVVINAPGNTTAGWFNEGSTLYIQPIVNFNNGTRLVKPSPSYVVVNGPATISVIYTRQYLVSIYAPTNTTATWVDAGAAILVSEPPVVDFGNGTRLVNPRLGGEPLPVVLEVNGPINVAVEYTRQYYVVINAPGNTTAGWFNEGSTLYMQPVINFGNGTRLVNPIPSRITVDGPITANVAYTRQYYVTQSSIFGGGEAWVDAGAQLAPNATTHVVNGVSFEPAYLVVNGAVEPVAPLTVDEPLNIAVIYKASVNVSTVAMGLPALYATATLTCGSKSTAASGFLASKLTLAMENPPTYECAVSTSEIPLTPIIIVAAAMIVVAAVLMRRGTKYHQTPTS